MQSPSESSVSGDRDRNQRSQSNNHKIFVTNLDGGANEDQLKKQLETLFKEYGTICTVVVRKSRNAEYSFAFIEYKPGEDAQQAIKNLDQTIIGGKKVKVQYQDNAKRRKDAKMLYLWKNGTLCQIMQKQKWLLNHLYQIPTEEEVTEGDQGLDLDPDPKILKGKKAKREGIVTAVIEVDLQSQRNVKKKKNDRKEESIKVPIRQKEKEVQKKTQIFFRLVRQRNDRMQDNKESQEFVDIRKQL